MIARPIARGRRGPTGSPTSITSASPNGLGVWLVPLPRPRARKSIHLLTDAGASSEDEAQAGVAALTAQLLVTGTGRLDAAAFAETTERLGIEVGSESSWDSARAGFTALGRHLDAGLSLLAEMIRTPRLDAGVRSAQGRAAERHPPGARRRGSPRRRELRARSLRRGRALWTPLRGHAGVGRDAQRRRDAARLPRHALRAERCQRRDRRRNRSRRGPRGRRASPGRLGGAPDRGHRTVEPIQRGGRRVVLVDRPGSVQSELRVGHLGIDRARRALLPGPWSWRRSSAASSAAA